MRAFPSHVVSKGGAEGVLAMGLPPGSLPAGAPLGPGPVGVAAKIEDGNVARRAGDVVSVEVLRQLGLAADPPILDPRGETAGDVHAVFRLTSH
jgi:L-asparaginase II